MSDPMNITHLPREILCQIFSLEGMKLNTSLVCKRFYEVNDWIAQKYWEKCKQVWHEKFPLLQDRMEQIERRNRSTNYQKCFQRLYCYLMEQADEVNINTTKLPKKIGSISVTFFLKIASETFLQSKENLSRAFIDDRLVKTDHARNWANLSFKEKLMECSELLCFDLSLRAIPKEVRFSQSCHWANYSRNLIRHVPSEIAELKTLEHLDLSDNRIEELPEEIGDLNLSRIKLQGNPLQSLPDSIGKILDTKSNWFLNHTILLDKGQFIKFHDHILKSYWGNLGGFKKCMRILHCFAIYAINYLLKSWMKWFAFVIGMICCVKRYSFYERTEYYSLEEIKNLPEGQIEAIEISFPIYYYYNHKYRVIFK